MRCSSRGSAGAGGGRPGAPGPGATDAAVPPSAQPLVAESVEAATPSEGAPAEPKPKKEAKKPRKRPSYPLKLFEKYELNDVEVHDGGLATYITPSPIVIPHTGGRYSA